jgi:replicative DNA helicase
MNSEKTEDNTIKTGLEKCVEHIERMNEKEGEIYGLSTGFTDIDELTGGLQPGNLVVVAGRPSMGATAFALNMAEDIALKVDKPVVFFDLATSYTEIAFRLMASLGRVDNYKVRTGKLEDDDWPRLTASINLLAGSKLIIDDFMDEGDPPVRSRMLFLASSARGDLNGIRFLL